MLKFVKKGEVVISEDKLNEMMRRQYEIGWLAGSKAAAVAKNKKNNTKVKEGKKTLKLN